MKYKKKIFLIGMPGSGKSTFGKRLSLHIHRPFFDLDHEIVRMMGMSIPDIFMDHGEEFFRELERAVLLMLIRLNEPTVISTGGGTPCFHHGIDVMNANGYTIFLDTPIDVIIARVTAKREERPLVSGMGNDVSTEMKALFDRRIGYYQQAQFTTDSNLEEVVQKLESLKN